MSATIKEGKMCFSVFGRGYEDTRTDSGAGVEEEVDRHWLLNGGMVLDSTGQYLWIAKDGDVNNRMILKYDLESFTDVGQTVVTAKDSYRIFHPSNVPNNYGVIISGSAWYVIDLTDDTLICSGADNLWFGYWYDCILVDDKIYAISLQNGRVNTNLVTIDLTNQTATKSVITTNRSTVCFASDSSIYSYFPIQWFTDYKKVYLTDLSGNQIWEETASQAGSGGFPYVAQCGFGGNGKIYLPTKIYGAWRLGEYSVSSAPDITTPKPKRFFGKFKSEPSLEINGKPRRGIAYNDGRTRVAFTTDIGVYVTDLEEVELLTEDTNVLVSCMNDTHVVCTSATGQYIYVFKYR